jgi:hypothetical protein
MTPFAWIIVIAAIVVLALAWWFIFRGAMKCSNNGNEFSRDDITGGPTQ